VKYSAWILTYYPSCANLHWSWWCSVRTTYREMSPGWIQTTKKRRVTEESTSDLRQSGANDDKNVPEQSTELD